VQAVLPDELDGAGRLPPGTRPRERVIATSFLVGVLSGCTPDAYTFFECPQDDPECTFLMYATGSQEVGNSIVLTDGDGCIQIPEPEDGCAFGGYSACGFQPNQFYSATQLCGDPVLAQWPDEWTVTSAIWHRAFPPPQSGSILIEPASNFDLPEGVGPIVTDPGYSAYVLKLSIDDIPLSTYVMRIEFDRGNLMAACVKGIEVAMITTDADDRRFIVPLEGESLDLTSYDAPDPHVFCMTPPTSVQPSTWGWIKGLYR
jgi:hypothetical protein